MSRLSDDALERIIQEQMPGHRIVRRESRGAHGGLAALDSPLAGVSSNADAATPDLEALKIKYLGPDYRARVTRSGTTRNVGDADSVETELVVLNADEGRDSFDRGAGPKTVIVDENGKIVGQQG